MTDIQTRSVDRSIELTKRAETIIPGVSQLISRRPRRAASGVSPPFAERAKGCRIWDVDGNEYLDFLAGIAVNAHGLTTLRDTATARGVLGLLDLRRTDSTQELGNEQIIERN